MKTSLKASLVAVAIASLSSIGHAAGLGQINVLSGLGQPLRAEIPVSGTAQELQSLSARIASPDAFRQANIPYAGVLSSLTVTVDNRGQRPVLRLSSDRPVNDPFLDLLIELDSSSGRLVREYTFLLDPVDLGSAARNGSTFTPAARPAPAVASASAPQPISAAPRSAVLAQQPAAAAATNGSSQYTVRRGDTLRRIAEANRPDGVTLDQMLIALYRGNPQAFDGGNINRLRAGAILSVPGGDAAAAVEAGEARREVIAHSADFEAYRRRLASSAVSRPAESAPVEQSSSGRITPRVEDARPAAENGDKVQVSRTERAGNANGGDAASRVQSLEEELVSREKALEEANARLAELERNIRDLQKLVELKSESLGQLQQQIQGGAAEPPAAPAAPPPAAPFAEVTPPPAAEAAPAVEVPAQPAPPPASQAAPRPPAPPKPPVPAPAPEPEEGFIQNLLKDPMLLAAGGGILILLLVYAAYRMRQKHKEGEQGDTEALMSEFPPESSGVFGGTGGQSVDTGNSSVIHTDFSQSGLSSIDADEGVDPVAEADVYMAYGRDAQAEEILQDALKADPARAAIYLKLLEIYAQRKSLKPFETTATELYGRTNGQGLDWEKAAQMGRKLDPENPLYNGGGVDAAANAPQTEQPLGPSAAAAAAGLGTVAGAMAVAAAQERADEKVDRQVESPETSEEPTGPSLASLDFTTSSPVDPSPSQLKDTWAMPGELGQLAESENEPLPAPEPLSPAEDMSLDFDLDLGEPEAGPVPPASLSETGGIDGSFQTRSSDLVLDLDVSGDEAPTEPPSLGSGEMVDSSRHQDSTVTVLGNEMDLASAEEPGLAFDLPELDVPKPSAPAFDMSATVIQSDEPKQEDDAAAVVDLEKTSFDSSLLDFDLDIDAPTATSVTEPPALDLTSIDLDLEPAVEEGTTGTATALPEAGGEVDTKLELARAYDEMGDKEGARELLEEVLKEGSAAQQLTARELMEKLG
ncbi:pilus assembly protein FimV [Azoarcus indigens]|uniref:Pilus assembly protein FimV n=2 Tax=Azoarcus indigens TaxID=29545 RepID=A0A4R6DX97_9RHOO|nr:pilus assembly protein FimV [Azoarcus indigens]